MAQSFYVVPEVILKQFNGLQMVKYQKISQKRSRFTASLEKLRVFGYSGPTFPHGNKSAEDPQTPSSLIYQVWVSWGSCSGGHCGHGTVGLSCSIRVSLPPRKPQLENASPDCSQAAAHSLPLTLRRNNPFTKS